MTKNKIREGPLPPPDKGVNDARPGLPTPTVRKNVTWVQPEPTTSDITRPQQLSPDSTWVDPSTGKVQASKRVPGTLNHSGPDKRVGAEERCDSDTLCGCLVV